MSNLFTARTLSWMIVSTLGHLDTKRNKGMKNKRINNVSKITRTGSEQIPLLRLIDIVLWRRDILENEENDLSTELMEVMMLLPFMSTRNKQTFVQRNYLKRWSHHNISGHVNYFLTLV
jgi:hypothetical protein